MNWTLETLIDAMGRHSQIVAKCLIVLFTRQEMDERILSTSRYRNEKGFNKFDARFLSHWAKRVTSGEELDADKAAQIRSKLMKYRKQLTRVLGYTSFGKTT